MESINQFLKTLPTAEQKRILSMPISSRLAAISAYAEADMMADVTAAKQKVCALKMRLHYAANPITGNDAVSSMLRRLASMLSN